MNGRTGLVIVLVLVLIAAGVGIGMFAFHAGVAQGLSESGKFTLPWRDVSLHPFAGHMGRPFGPLGFMLPLVGILLVFGLFRALCRGRVGDGGFHGYWSDGVPPRFEEWHRGVHQKQDEPRA